MADRFYGAAVGAQLPENVTEASSTTSAAVELRISDSAYSAGKQSIVCAIRAILQYVETKEGSVIG